MGSGPVIRVAVVQPHVTPLAPHVNRAHALELAKEALRRGARIILFPEAMDLGWPGALTPKPDAQMLLEAASPLPSAWIEPFADLARAYGAAICIGVVERAASTDVLYNTLAMLLPDGRLAAYRKTHLAVGKDQDEASYFQPGNHLVSVTATGARCGPMICFDLNFPEVARALAPLADLLLLSACWMPAAEVRWHALIPARAAENQIYVAASNYAGPPYLGHSKIVDFAGSVMVELGADAGIGVADLDLHELQRARGHRSFLTLRRPAVYGVVETESADERMT